jgi:hypothetical protein
MGAINWGRQTLSIFLAGGPFPKLSQTVSTIRAAYRTLTTSEASYNFRLFSPLSQLDSILARATEREHSIHPREA